jgi:hypothetical protein
MEDSVADLSGIHSFSFAAPNVTATCSDRDDATKPAGDLPAVSAPLEVKTTPVVPNTAESSTGAQSPIDPLSQVSQGFEIVVYPSFPHYLLYCFLF